jgi:hypothetical protein
MGIITMVLVLGAGHEIQEVVMSEGSNSVLGKVVGRVHALRVRELEHAGDELKDRNMDVFNRAFSTPMDREELYRAISTIDHVINYAKTTVREMEALGVEPDQSTTEIAATSWTAPRRCGTATGCWRPTRLRPRAAPRRPARGSGTPRRPTGVPWPSCATSRRTRHSWTLPARRATARPFAP